MLYALQSKDQKYFEERINVFISIAPAGKVSNIDSIFPGKFMTRITYIFLDVWNKFVGWYRLFDDLERGLAKFTCVILPDFCIFFVDGLIYSSNLDLDDPIKYQVLMGHMPGGASLKNLFSFFQSKLTDKFQDWDYDMEFLANTSNWDEYGQAKPP